MTSKKLLSLHKAAETSDSAGVSIRRSLGMPTISHHDPFLLLDEFYSEGPEAGPGFPDHPHRGFSTLTYMVKGQMNHADNKGNAGRVGPGGFQWMTAGKGIVHSERPEVEHDGMRGIQLWINLPGAKKMKNPFYINGESRDVPEVPLKNGSVSILAGEFKDARGPIKNDEVDLHYFDVNLKKEEDIKIPLPKKQNALLYILQGSVAYGSETLDFSTLAILGEGDFVFLKAFEASRLVLISGNPIGEPVARYGPFVMNTREEIETAIKDFQQGNF